MPKRGTQPKTRISTARLNAELQRMQDYAQSLKPKSDLTTGWLQACTHLNTWLTKETMA